MPPAQRVVRIALSALLAACCALGCASTRIPTPSNSVVRAPWHADPPTDECRPETDKLIVDGLSAQLAAPAPAIERPINVLALSAGGKYGAYSAGLLCGWTANGTRPNFDIVTGVSSGAILALYAFLGPQYDHKIKCFFTEYDQSDLFPVRPLRNLPFHGSMASPKGLKRIIAEELNPSTLAEIAQAHRAGRRLYLATLNIHSKRLVVWDIGGIACSGRDDALELVRKVVLAATAVPALLPPVEFDVTVNGQRYKELHCDAGPATQTFVRFGPLEPPKPGTRWLAGSQLYCLAAGKIEPDPVQGRLGFIKRISVCVSASLYALYKLELVKLYALCLTTGMQFNMAAIPPDADVDVNSTTIQASAMRPLFKLGYEAAVRKIEWRQTPPGAIEGEESHPRSGLGFTTGPQAK